MNTATFRSFFFKDQPAPLLLRPQSEIRPMNGPTISKDTLRKIIDEVENDPLAGMGSLSKKDILVDRLLAHIRTTTAPAAKQVTPLVLEPTAQTSAAKAA